MLARNVKKERKYDILYIINGKMRKKYTAPFYVDISITDSCNLKCVYCYAEATARNKNHIDVGLFAKIAKEIEEKGVHYMRIAGGEPFIHPNINEILDICGKIKMLKSISTNATLLDQRKVEKIIENEINWVVVSLDGVKKEINDFTRGKFDETIKGIKLLVNNKVITKIACVVSSSNYNQIEEIVDFAENLGLYSVGFILQSDVGRAHQQTNIALNPEQMNDFMNKVTELKIRSTKVKVHVIFPYESCMPWELSTFLDKDKLNEGWNEYVDIEKNDDISCMAGITTCAVSSKGELFGCEQMLGFPELSAGNLGVNSFESLWDDFGELELLRNADKSMLPTKCQNCLSYCGGGCRAQAYSYSKKLFGEDIRCQVLRKE